MQILFYIECGCSKASAHDTSRSTRCKHQTYKAPLKQQRQVSLIQVPLQQRQVPKHLFSARGRKQGGGGAGGPGGAGAGAEEGAGAGAGVGAGAGTSKTAPISTLGAGDAARLRSLLAPAVRSAGKDTTTRPKNTEPEAYLPLPCVFSQACASCTDGGYQTSE